MEGETGGEDAFVRLETLLAEHLRQVANGDFESVLKDGAEVANLLDVVSGSGVESMADGGERIKRVVDLHRRLHLLIATEKEQLQLSLSKMRRGKRALRKYQGGGARLS